MRISLLVHHVAQWLEGMRLEVSAGFVGKELA